jgi:hypothetical protein
MTARTLIRLSMGMQTLFLVGHGLGSLVATTRDATEASVFTAMQAYTFPIMGVTRTHWDFYQGLNHYLTAAIIVFLALHVVAQRLLVRAPAETRGLLLTLAFGQVLFAGLSWTYFFPAPGVMTTVSAVCLVWAALHARTSD